MHTILEAFHVPQLGDTIKVTTLLGVLQSGYYWPLLYKDDYNFVNKCDQCQKEGLISKHHKMLMTKMLKVELFDV